MKAFVLFNVICVISSALTEDVRLDNLDPPEAQQLIESKDTSLKYAPKVDSNVPATRFIGNEPQQVLEDIYLANQYHGQDGVGGYLYGYSVPDISKTEKKKAGGDLRGAYNYISGDGQEIKVEYWDDGTGFHQIDNVPKILPKQIPDSPEVQAAKDEHARIWKEEAERNSRPIENPYPNANPGAYAGLGAGQGAGQPTQQSGYGVAPKSNFGSGVPAGVYHGAGQYQAPGGPGFIGGQGQGQGSYSQSNPQEGADFGGSKGVQGQGAGFGGSQGAQGQGAGFGGSQGQGAGFGGSQVQGAGFGGSQGAQGQGAGFGHAGKGGSFGSPSGAGGSGGYGQGGSGGFGQGGSFGSGGPGKGGSYGSQGAQGQGSYGQSGSGFGQAGTGFGSGSSAGAGHSGSGGFGQPSGSGFGGHQGSSSYNNQNKIDYTGQYSENQNTYAGNPQQKNDWENAEDNEEKGPPKGFFYNVDYPVGIIVSKQGGPQKRESLTDIYSKQKSVFDQQLKAGAAVHGGSSYPSYQVHA